MAIEATTAQRDRVRGMVAEPSTDTYTDDQVDAFIEAYPLPDADGLAPTADDWTATFDLNGAAADIWQEKAALLTGKFDVGTDGNSISRNQLFQNANRMVKLYRARSVVKTIRHKVDPDISSQDFIAGNVWSPDDLD